VSDYLGHLALRLLAPERVIQPRLPSVFEARTSPALTSPALMSAEAAWAAAATEPIRTLPRDVVEEGAPSTVATLIPHDVSIVVDAAATGEDSRREGSAPASPKPISREDAKARRATPLIERVTAGSEADSPALEHSSTPIAENAVQARTAAPAQSVRLGQQSVPAETNTVPFEPEGKHATPVMEATTIVENDVPAHAVVRERRTQRLVERIRVRHDRTNVVQESDSHAAPIEITIGRVDVRAVIGSSTPAAPPRAKKSPMLSLEDYLARREGGRR
jgi:hypothetical protein